MTSQRVGAPKWNDSERASSLRRLRNETLHHFVNCAVASAGKDHISKCGSLTGLNCGRSGTCSGNDLRTVPFDGQRLGNLPNLRLAQVSIAAGGGIIDQDAAHQIILGPVAVALNSLLNSDFPILRTAVSPENTIASTLCLAWILL